MTTSLTKIQLVLILFALDFTGIVECFSSTAKIQLQHREKFSNVSMSSHFDFRHLPWRGYDNHFSLPPKKYHARQSLLAISACLAKYMILRQRILVLMAAILFSIQAGFSHAPVHATSSTPQTTLSVSRASAPVDRKMKAQLTPFTKIANAVSNALLIGGTAAAGAGLGRYFILTKEAEKENEVLARSLLPTSTLTVAGSRAPVEVGRFTTPLNETKGINFPSSKEQSVIHGSKKTFHGDRSTVGTEAVSVALPLKNQSSEVPEDAESIAEVNKVRKVKEKAPREEENTEVAVKANEATIAMLQLQDDKERKAQSMAAILEASALNFPPAAKKLAWTEEKVKIRKQVIDLKDEEVIASRYAAMNPEQRAYSILLDLGMIEENQDPDDPLYDATFDDEFYIDTRSRPIQL